MGTMYPVHRIKVNYKCIYIFRHNYRCFKLCVLRIKYVKCIKLFAYVLLFLKIMANKNCEIN